MRTIYAFVFLPALAGAILAAVAFFGPSGNTGVDGTPGALLALVGAAVVALGALTAMMPRVVGWALQLLNVLIVIGTALTAAAAFFLMQYPFAMVMALALIGALFAAAVPKTRKPA